MSTTPTGDLSLPVDYLATTLAGSTTLQTWVGTPGNAAAAKAKISIEEAAAGTTPPIVVVGAGDYNRERIATGTTNFYMGHGSLFVLFRDSITSGEGAVVADALYTFLNTVGAVMREALALSGQAGYLDIKGARQDGPAQRTDYQESQGNTVGAFFEVAWVVEFEAL